jgi:DNA-binding MarR family transcriptional regulator
MADLDAQAMLTTLLRTAYNLLSADIYREVSAGATDLRPAHGNVMEMLSIEDGLRLTDLSARAGMAPQSMGELVDELEARGYVERRADPDDRRAKGIYLTKKGLASARRSRKACDAVESGVVELLGAAQYRSLRRTLVRIIERAGASTNE